MPVKQINDNGTVFDIGQDQVTENSIYPVKSSGIYNFVNSSVATNTANFVGTYNSIADLEAHTDYQEPLTNNDYGFVVSTDLEGNTVYNRYKYNSETEQWAFEYALNNSSFTANQWQTINSGLTSTDKTQIGTNANDILSLQTSLSYLKNQTVPSSLAYDNTATYSINDYCTYNNNLYRCIVDITVAEDFTVAHWELTTVVADLTTINNTIGDINTVLEGVL